MRASFLLDPPFVRSLDPNFYGFPIRLDCSTYGRLVFASSYEERVPLYLRQQTDHSPVARIPIRKCCNGICCRSGTRVPMHHFYKRGVVAAMDGKGGIGSSITLNRSAPSMDCWVSKVKSSWGEPPYSSPKFNHAMSVPGFLARSYPSISI